MRKFFYVGANSQDAEGGIQIYRSEASGGGTFPELEGVIPMKGASYMAFSRNGRFFYAVRNDAGTRAGSADVFRVEEEGRRMVLLASAPTFGRSSCHLTTSPDDAFLYCANYSSGSFTEFKLKDGVFDGPGKVMETHGELGPVTDRQERTHAHCVCFTPDNKFLCVVDLGADSVFLYRYTAGKGIEETPSFTYREMPGQGPRHILFAPDGKHAWIVNELGNTVSTLAYAEGKLQRLANISTIPADFKAYTKASALRLSPDGRLLLVTNRGHESIACYDAAPDASLTLREIIPSCGVSPRDVNFLPSGDRIAACNEMTNNTTFFTYEAQTGKIGYTGVEKRSAGSLCVI